MPGLLQRPNGLLGVAVMRADGRPDTLPAVMLVDVNGNPLGLGSGAAPTAGTNLSGTATTTSGGFNIPANANRKPGDVQGQNVSTNNIGVNEFGGVAAIGSPGTFTVPPNASFSITTNNLVNFIAATGNSAVTITSL